MGILLNNIKPRSPQLFLAKPDMTIISKLKEAYNIRFDEKLTELSELSFSVPFRLDNYLDIQTNGNIPLIREKFLVKMVFGTNTQWFEIDEIKDNADNTDVKEIHAFLLPYQLSDKNIRSYQADTQNANTILVDLLKETVWGVGYIDSLYLTRYRSVSIDSSTVLDAVIQVGQTFNALIVWDTTNRTVNFYQPQNIGHDTGMTFNYRKYLQSLSQESKTDGMVTRLKVYGKDGLTIATVNPTGTSYLEDFSYFLYPFQQDGSGNVIQSSNYMKDDLCKAIINYNTLLTNNATNFSNLLTQLKTYQTDMTALKTQLDTLNNDLIIIQQSLDRANSLGDTATVSAKIIEKNNKQTAINSKTTEVTNKQTQINGVQTQINNLKTTLSVEANFTAQQIKDRSLFIIEKEISDDNIVDVNDLYKMAQEKLAELKTPILSATINIVNFKEMVTEIDNWDRLEIGDTVRATHDITGIDIKAKIVAISYDFENKSISITISNVKKTKSEGDMLLDLLYKGASTSNTVNMNKFKWDMSTDVQTTLDEWFNNQFDATKQQITAGINQSIEIGRKGIIIRDSDTPLNMLVAQNGVLALSNDGGNTYKTAIKPTGIVAEQIAGKLIIGTNLYMENVSGKFRFDKDGVTIDGASLTITGGIKESQLDPALTFMKTDFTYSNGIRIDSTNGIVVTKSNNKSKAILNATQGLVISKSSDGINWSDVFYADSNGNLNITGNITMTGGSVSWGSVTGAPTIPTALSQLSGYKPLTYIDSSGVYTGTIVAGQITAGTINANMISGGTLSGVNIATLPSGSSATVELMYDTVQFKTAGALKCIIGQNLNTLFLTVTGGYTGVWVDTNLTVSGSLNVGGSAVATQSYVTSYVSSQGFITSSSLSGYAQLGTSVSFSYITADNSVYCIFMSASGNASVGGNLTVSGKINGTTVGSSDRRLKKDIVEYSDDALSHVLNTPVYKYRYKKESENEPLSIGIMAQESPQDLVADIIDNDDNKSLGINHYSMMSMLWKATQQQNELIRELREEINSLKSNQ